MSDATIEPSHERLQTSVRARLIVNPEAWQATASTATLDHICDTLQQYGIDAEVALITAEHDGAQLAAAAVADHYDMVIAAGGDGTVHEIALGLRATNVTLGIIPLGTMNNLAYSLHIPDDLEAACKIIATGKRKKIDIGLVNGKTPFLEVVSVGVEAAFFPLAESARHHGIGGVVQAAIGGTRLLFRSQMHPVTLEIDGKVQRIRAWQITICNTPVYGLHFAAAPRARMDDGFLDVVITRQKQRLDLLRHYRSIMSGKREPDMAVKIVRARRVRISGHYRLPVAADGNALDTTPVTVAVVPKALTVMTGTTATNIADTPPSPLTALMRSIALQNPEKTNDRLHSPEEVAERMQTLTRFYWLALPVLTVLMLLSRLAHWGPFATRPGDDRHVEPVLREHQVAPHLLATVLAAIFARLRLPLEVLAFMATGVLGPLSRGLRFVTRRHPNIVAPDEGTMRAVAGTGILVAGLWASRRATWQRNSFIMLLLATGGWFARVSRHTTDTPERERDAIALGAGLGALWLGGSLGVLTRLQRSLYQVVNPAARTSVVKMTQSSGATILAPSAPAAQDIAPVAIMTKLERGDILLFGPDQTIGARLIEFLTRSNYHHIAVYDGDGMVIEAMPEGIRRYPLGARTVTGIRPNVLPEQHIAAADWSRQHVGGTYDRRGLALIAFDRIFPGLRLGSPSASRFSCAVFVADAYLHAGVDLFPGERWQDLVPGDFMALLNMSPLH